MSDQEGNEIQDISVVEDQDNNSGLKTFGKGAATGVVGTGLVLLYQKRAEIIKSVSNFFKPELKEEQVSGLNKSLSDVETPEREEPIPLFAKTLFFKKESTLLVSEAGVGKSFLSIEIGKHSDAGRVHYILLDDGNEGQLARYKAGDIYNKNSVFLESDSEKLERIVESLYEEVAVKKTVVTTAIDMIENQLKQLLDVEYDILENFKRNLNLFKKEYGIKKKNRVTKMLSFAMYIDSLKGKVDYIIIDALYHLSEYSNDYYDPKELTILLKAASRNDMGILIIHHSNNKGGISGGKSINRAVDSCYTLSRVAKEHDYEILNLEVIKSRYVDISGSVYELKKEKVSQDEASFSILSVNSSSNESNNAPTTINGILIYIIQNHREPIITRTELEQQIQHVFDKKFKAETIDKALARLLKGGRIAKESGNSWKTIRILENNQNIEKQSR